MGILGPILIIVLSATGLLLAARVRERDEPAARTRGRAGAERWRSAWPSAPGRGRIVRQLLTESVLLAVAGAAVGLLVAYVGVRLLLAIRRRDAAAARCRAVRRERPAASRSITLIVSGVLVGFAPALRLARTDVRALMNESGRTASGGRGTARWLNAMTSPQIALAIMLVAGAGWLIRGFEQLRATNPGFVADKRLVFDVSLQGPKYNNSAAVIAGWNELFDRLRSIPGVTAVGATSALSAPRHAGELVARAIAGRDRSIPPSRWVAAAVRQPGTLQSDGRQDARGPRLHMDDRQGTTPVAIVNKTFVRRNLSGRIR